MKEKLMKVSLFILIAAMLLTSCGIGKKEALPATENNVEEKKDDKEAEVKVDETTVVEEEEEGELDVSLFDRALLESLKFNWPDSYTMIGTEDSSGVITTITTYQKGYSKREERLSEGETMVEIYNADEGITYEYTVGNTTGFMTKDDEDDIESLETDKAMVGKSVMTIFEEFYDDDVIIKAKSVRMLGRRAVEIEISDGSPEEGEESSPWLFVLDSKYTVGLKTEVSFGEDYNFFMEATEVDFNKKLKDSLFEPPKDVVFDEY